jgi:HD superfamily phosphohydrolase
MTADMDPSLMCLSTYSKKNYTRPKKTSHPGIIEKSEVADILAKMGYNPKEIAALAVGKLDRKDRAFLDQIISSAVDVDKMDFIVRDTYHTGAEYGFIDVYRLIHALDLLGENLAVELGALSGA